MSFILFKVSVIIMCTENSRSELERNRQLPLIIVATPGSRVSRPQSATDLPWVMPNLAVSASLSLSLPLGTQSIIPV